MKDRSDDPRNYISLPWLQGRHHLVLDDDDTHLKEVIAENPGINDRGWFRVS